MKLSFNGKQTDTIVKKEVERLKADGISKLLFGNDIVDYCEPEIPDMKDDGLEELRFTDAEVEILIEDFIDSCEDPYRTLTDILGGDDSFIVDEEIDHVLA